MKNLLVKLLIVFLSVAVVFLVGIYVGMNNYNFLGCLVNNLSLKKCQGLDNSSINISFKISEGKNEGNFFEFNYPMGWTALEFMESVANIVTKGEGTEAYVISINGRKANESKKEFWAFYVNGKLADVGAGSYKLKEGDKIEWKLENY